MDDLQVMTDAELRACQELHEHLAAKAQQELRQRTDRLSPQRIRRDAVIAESLPYLDAALAYLTEQGYVVEKSKGTALEDYFLTRYAIIAPNNLVGLIVVDDIDEQHGLVQCAIWHLGNLRVWAEGR